MTVITREVLSPNGRTGRSGKKTLWLVVHDMESPEGRTTALDVAAYFARPSTKTSAHRCIDATQIVQTRRIGDIAWHAGAHGNLYGVGYELAGRARQTRAEWLDVYSRAVISNAAAIMVEDAGVLGIPLRLLTDAEVRALKPGITTHAQLTRCFPGETTHSDPGPAFPMDVLLADIAALTGKKPATAKTPKTATNGPKHAASYTVRKGDTAYSIARKQGISAGFLIAALGGAAAASHLSPGQVIPLPGPAPVSSPTAKPTPAATVTPAPRPTAAPTALPSPSPSSTTYLCTVTSGGLTCVKR